MKKDIRQFLHLYIGAEVETNIKGQYVHPYGNVTIEVLTPENYNLIMDSLDRKERYEKEGDSDLSHLYCRLKCRPLSSMTEGEAIELAKLSEWEPHFRDVKVNRNNFGDLIVTWDGMVEGGETFNATGELSYTSEQFQWLLKNHFDLFHLIEDGLALDITKQPAQ